MVNPILSLGIKQIIKSPLNKLYLIEINFLKFLFSNLFKLYIYTNTVLQSFIYAYNGNINNNNQDKVLRRGYKMIMYN